MPTSHEGIRDVLLSAVDFLRSKDYLLNPDVIVLCQVARALVEPTHNMIVNGKLDLNPITHTEES